MPITPRRYDSPAFEQMRNSNLATLLQTMRGGQESDLSSQQAAQGLERDKQDNQLKTLLLGKQQQLALEQQKQELANEQASDLQGTQKLADMAPGGASYSYGKARLGQDPMAKMALKQQQGVQSQRGAFGKEVSASYKDIPSTLDTVELLNQYLDDPNSFNDKKIAVLQARLAEGKGQRLLQSVIQSFGNKASGLKSATDMFNYLSGQATSGIPDEQRNAVRKSSFDVAAEAEKQYGDITQQLKARGQAVYPDLAASGGVDPIIDATGIQVKQGLGRINALRAKYTQQAPANTPPPAYQQPRGIVNQLGDKLSNLFSNQSQGIRVRNKTTGQTGTLTNPAEFDPKLYDRVN